MKRKVMLSVAPVSAADTDIQPEKIAQDVLHCYENGASMVHLHARDRRGRLTPDLTVLAETVERIREKCDIVIEVSTGGVSELTIEERCMPCSAPWAEALSLNVGSVNLGEAVYRNPIRDVRYCVGQILAQGKVPEIEVFELGMIHTVRELARTFAFADPLLFALVFGHAGEMPATLPALRHMVQFLDEEFGGEKPYLWGYTQAGRRDWELVRQALRLGAFSVRIGFEDSDYLAPDRRAAENAPLIARAAEVLREEDAEPMTAAELRRALGIC